jgi:hypothetical protein
VKVKLLVAEGRPEEFREDEEMNIAAVVVAQALPALARRKVVRASG